ncbi:MAG: hypothetical protein M3Z96_02510 [Pseudomonadota bacterium]|nr:hypothetical protein [Pseudomonadota bacterium]
MTFVAMGQYRRVAPLERIFINHLATLRCRAGAGNPLSVPAWTKPDSDIPLQALSDSSLAASLNVNTVCDAPIAPSSERPSSANEVYLHRQAGLFRVAGLFIADVGNAVPEAIR